MKVRLELLGPLRLPPEGRLLERSYRKGTSVKTVLRDTLALRDQEMKFLQVIRDGTSLALNHKLDEDANLKVMMRLGGG